MNNTVGLSGTSDLEDVVLTLGYDHLNFVSSSGQFSYADSATGAALQLLTHRQARVVGLVFNRTGASDPSYHCYKYPGYKPSTKTPTATGA